MTMLRGLAILAIQCLVLIEGFHVDPRQYPTHVNVSTCPGTPLFLSKFVEKGHFKLARELSRVGPLEGVDHESHAGYFTVNKETNSNMYFWFWPAQKDPEKAPLLLWLQGGPGSSSLFGMFVENGPYTVSKTLKLIPRPVNWNTKYSILYIDNPVGTGFSFTDSDSGYATNEMDVARDLYSCLSQFFLVFNDYLKNPFYIVGESYGGKYAPAIGYKIHKENEISQDGDKINLVGIAIGDGVPDPVSMIPHYAEHLYNIGMLDEKQRHQFQKMTNQAVKLIQQNRFKDALLVMDRLLSGKMSQIKSFLYNATHTDYLYNFLQTKAPEDFGYYVKLLEKQNVRCAIHVGSLPFHDETKVELHLLDDIMDTVKTWLTELMEKYKVLIYNGQLDIIVAAPLTEASLMTYTDWTGLDRYKAADRSVWKVQESDSEVAGYVRQVDNFYQVIVRGGGHILPNDQPTRSFDMIDRFISNRGFT